MMVHTINDIPLDELASIEVMSVRALNACYRAGLNSLNRLLEFYTENGNFRTINKCGETTESELVDICKRYLKTIENIQPSTEVSTADKTFEIVNILNPFKRAALNRHVDFLLSTLSARAKNGIISLFGKNPAGNELINVIYSKDFEFTNIKNIGAKSSLELVHFKKNISKFVKTIENLENNQLNKEYTKLVTKASLVDVPKNIDELLETVFDANNRINLFSLIRLLIDDDILLKKAEKEIFYYSFTYSNEKSLEEIAKTLEIGKERVRQIKVGFENDLKVNFKFLLNLWQEDLPRYGVEPGTVLMEIGDEFATKINIAERVNFTPQFYSSILSMLHENSHAMLGSFEVETSRNRKIDIRRFHYCYLIDRTLFNSFDFSLFLNSVVEILNERIIEDYYLHFQGFLSQFLKQNENISLAKISLVCERLLFNEFDLVINTEGYLVFERNTKKQIAEYLTELLEELGEMTKVETIHKLIEVRHPYLETSEQSIRASLQREKGLFIYIGRSSTYGLKKWQFERDNLKGGTIRDIVEEFLEKESEPKHISEITLVVQKYRNTSEYNIRANLELEDSCRFRFFPGEFIGLYSRKYSNVENFKKTIGSHFRTALFKNMNGWHFTEIVSHFVEKFNYHRVQVESLINKKIDLGELNFSEERILEI